MTLRSACLTSVLLVFGFAAESAPVTYNFSTEITSATKVSGGTAVDDPSSPLLGTTGTASLSIDTDNIVDDFYVATSSEFSFTHDFGAGPEAFTGADDFFGGAIIAFDPLYNIIDVIFDVVDDDPSTPANENRIAAAGIIDFTSTGFASNTMTLEVRSLVPVPLPASAILLIGGIGGLAALRRKSTVRT